MPSPSSRRKFVRNALAGAGLWNLPLLLSARAEADVPAMKIVCVGGHPDDPESGCGGTLARFQSLGHSVTIIYLTSGEAGIRDKSHAESAAIRTQEAKNACEILKAKPVFAGQIDGDSIVNNEWVKKITALLAEEKPDIVFTHWPVDTHKDHQAASLLTMQAWQRTTPKFALYFFEVCAGEQTMTFHPTDYVDITATQEQKRKSVYCHLSQDPPGIYACGHTIMEAFRGTEIGVKAAEAFVRVTGQRQGTALPV